MKEFIEKLAEILEVEETELSEDEEFRDIESWDSLAELSVLAMAQDDYGRDLSTADFKSVNTVSELYALITSTS